MLRTIGAVIAGYIVMGVFVFVSFTLVYLAMGTERAFKPESYDTSMLWNAASLLLGVIAAIAGGFVCTLIAPNSGAWKGLAGLVVVLGLLMAIPVITADKSKLEPRGGDVKNMDAMLKAQQPVWSAVVNPFIGAWGVTMGARRKK